LRNTGQYWHRRMHCWNRYCVWARGRKCQNTLNFAVSIQSWTMRAFSGWAAVWRIHHSHKTGNIPYSCQKDTG
jgi:hypothetical protein